MTYRECYETAALRLKAAGVPEAKLDARILLEYVCHTNYNTLLVHDDRIVTETELEAFADLIAKRERRIPWQQLTGEQDFCGLTFKVNEHVLIPRQDTEILVEAVLEKIKPGMKVLDMCTGSGCILISLISMAKDVTGTGVDISEQALLVAKENAKRLLPEEKSPVLLCGDLFNAFEGADKEATQFDILVSNPPYIESDVIETLMPEVKEYEPRMALDGSEDGLLFYRRIVSESAPYLKENGYLMFEIGHDQAEAVSDLMADAGFADIEVIKDYAGLDRVVRGRRQASE